MDNKAAIEAALAINKTLSKLDRETRLAAIEIVDDVQTRVYEHENCENGHHDFGEQRFDNGATLIFPSCIHCGARR